MEVLKVPKLILIPNWVVNHQFKGEDRETEQLFSFLLTQEITPLLFKLNYLVTRLLDMLAWSMIMEAYI